MRSRAPTGTIPNQYNTPYPAFQNQGTTQPKFDLRVDYDHPDGRQKIVFGGGIAGTEGMIHTGIGPFDMDSGTTMAYAKVNYSRGALKLNFFTNILDGNATNLLAYDVNGQPIEFIFKNKTYDIEFGNVVTLGTRNVVSYGGNYRRNNFDLSLAPRAGRSQRGWRLHPGRDLPQRQVPLDHRRPRRQVRLGRGLGLLAAHDADVQARRRPDGSACRSTARSVRRRSSTTTSRRPSSTNSTSG